MGERDGAVPVGGDRGDVEVVGYIISVNNDAIWGGGLTKRKDIRNGPPSLGRLESLYVYTTPSPDSAATAVTSPSIFPPSGYAGLNQASAGRTALYTTPTGLLLTMVASPSFYTIPVSDVIRGQLVRNRENIRLSQARPTGLSRRQRGGQGRGCSRHALLWCVVDVVGKVTECGVLRRGGGTEGYFIPFLQGEHEE